MRLRRDETTKRKSSCLYASFQYTSEYTEANQGDIVHLEVFAVDNECSPSLQSTMITTTSTVWRFHSYYQLKKSQLLTSTSMHVHSSLAV